MKQINEYINEALIKKDTKIDTHHDLGLNFNEFLKQIKLDINGSIDKYRAVLLAYGFKDIDKCFFNLISIDKELNSDSEKKVLKDLCEKLTNANEYNAINKYGNTLKSIYKNRADGINFWSYIFEGTDDYFKMIIITNIYDKKYWIYKVTENPDK